MNTSDKGISMVSLPLVADSRGNLSFVQQGQAVPFAVSKVWWIHDANAHSGHMAFARRTAPILLIALNGCVTATVNHNDVRTLRRSDQALMVEPMHWIDLSDFSIGAVVLVIEGPSLTLDDTINDCSILSNELSHEHN